MNAHNYQEASQNIAKVYHIFCQEKEEVENLLTNYYDQRNSTMKYQDSASDEEEVDPSAHKDLGASMATDAHWTKSEISVRLRPFLKINFSNFF
jgi:hypothetical protein